MTMIAPLNPPAITGPSQPPAGPADKTELREVAEQFEAIFVRRMLAAARSSTFADKSPFSGANTGGGLEQFQTMRDDHFADLAAQGGGLGLADQIEKQLAAVLRQNSAAEGA